MWIVYLVALLYGVSFVALPAALNGLLKLMLPDELLLAANASLSTTREALRLVGPLAGAGIYTVIGGGGVAAIDAASFVIAGLAVAAVSVADPPPERGAGHWRVEFMAGVNVLRHDEVLRPTLVAVAVALLVIGFMESALFAMVDAFERPASFVGVVVSVQGIGAVAGGVCSSRIVRALGETTTVTLSLAGFAVGLAVCAASPFLGVVFVGVIVLGFTLPVFLVAFNTLLQRRTPQQVMGRVSTATDALLGTPQAVSIAVGAWLVSVISYRSIYGLCAAVTMGSAGWLAWALRRRE